MRPEFYRYVDPIFVYVIQLQERLENASLDPEQVLEETRSVIDKAESRLGQSREWLLAKYALVAWIDELLMAPVWSGSEWWVDRCLEVHYFDAPRQAHSAFFEKAREASELVNKDPIEVYYVCVLLGFRGLYHDNPTASELARQYNLPADIRQWIKRTAGQIHLGFHNVSLEPARPAPDRTLVMDGKRRLLKWVLAAFVLAVIALIAGIFALEESKLPPDQDLTGAPYAAVIS